MENPARDIFMANWLKTHAFGVLPGAMLMKYGPENYIGATLAMRGTLYFHGSHTPDVRQAICQCFERYESIAKQNLTWLWREEPPEGPNKFAYPKARPLRDMIGQMDENDHVGFTYLGGKSRTMQVLGCSGYQGCAVGKRSSDRAAWIRLSSRFRSRCRKQIRPCFNSCSATSHVC